MQFPAPLHVSELVQAFPSEQGLPAQVKPPQVSTQLPAGQVGTQAAGAQTEQAALHTFGPAQPSVPSQTSEPSFTPLPQTAPGGLQAEQVPLQTLGPGQFVTPSHTSTPSTILLPQTAAAGEYLQQICSA